MGDIGSMHVDDVTICAPSLRGRSGWRRGFAFIPVLLLAVAAVIPYPAGAQSKNVVLSVIDAGTIKDKDAGAHVYDVGRYLFARRGYEVEYVPLSFLRALDEVKSGRLDGIFGIYYTDERARFFEYSNKIWDTEVVFYARKDRGITYKNLSDLKNYSIGVLRGAANGKAFEAADYLNKQVLSRKSQAVQMLAMGRIDLYVDTRIYFKRLLAISYPELKDQFVSLRPPLVARGI